MASQPLPPLRPRIPVECLHKNRLQEYVQKSAMPLPIYETVNEGSAHEPKFRSTVHIDGSAYTSQTFPQRKEAEQDAAKLALSNILKKVTIEGCPIINEDITLCKSIVNEFAVKMNLGFPTYETVQLEGLLPSFVSTAEFHGQTYTSNPGKNKKEAEQLVARVIIQTLLGKADARARISEIVNAKKKLYAAFKTPKSNDPPAGPSFETSKSNDPPAGPSSRKLTEVTTPETKPFKKPKLENSCEPSVVSTGNVAASVNPPPYANTGVAAHFGGAIPSVRKRKNKNRGQTGMPTDGSLRPGASPRVQTAACSVTQ